MCYSLFTPGYFIIINNGKMQLHDQQNRKVEILPIQTGGQNIYFVQFDRLRIIQVVSIPLEIFILYDI